MVGLVGVFCTEEEVADVPAAASGATAVALAAVAAALAAITRDWPARMPVVILAAMLGVFFVALLTNVPLLPSPPPKIFRSVEIDCCLGTSTEPTPPGDFILDESAENASSAVFIGVDGKDDESIEVRLPSAADETFAAGDEGADGDANDLMGDNGEGAS